MIPGLPGGAVQSFLTGLKFSSTTSTATARALATCSTATAASRTAAATSSVEDQVFSHRTEDQAEVRRRI